MAAKMNAKSETTQFRLDALKWLMILAIIAVGVYANSVYGAVTLLYRALIGVVMAAAVTGIALQTEKGHAAWELAKEARTEMRKVIWPTRQELTQTTLIVVVVVIVVGMLLWGLDSGLSWAIKGVIG
ncbi:MAG: preprotein translocase subunit SecE [Proteobacteria bacterium]|jgi:preprotein translocase subunit SecE|nr:preprotein translocase subunit SecE [Pseudomonadota bacterium]MDA1298444.1 preprotein translocase subunit SecE [Pseudomonadota bacterium]